MINYDGAIKDQTAALAETAIIARDSDFGGRLDFQLYLKQAATLGTLGVVFRWRDRNGNAATRSFPLLLATVPGILAEGGFELWTENDTGSNVTVEVTTNGIVGSPVYDFMFTASGASFG